MKKLFFEAIIALAIVIVGTFIVYGRLAGAASFWNAQSFWNPILVICWLVVASGYVHQGYLVHKRKSAAGVSTVLPCAVFIVQCILFIKGIYYNDKSLIIGALLVNSGVVFAIYQIFKAKKAMK